MPPFLQRGARAAFWIAVPFTILGILIWPRSSVIVVGSTPFSLEINPVPTGLPSPLADLFLFYPATLLAAGVLLLCKSARHRRWRALHERAVPLPTFFLPAYVAGIESIGLISWSMRCHSVTAPPPLQTVVLDGALLSGAVLLSTMLLGSLAAKAWGHRARIGLPLPPAVGAIAAAIAVQWWFLFAIVSPRPN